MTGFLKLKIEMNVGFKVIFSKKKNVQSTKLNGVLGHNSWMGRTILGPIHIFMGRSLIGLYHAYLLKTGLLIFRPPTFDIKKKKVLDFDKNR